MQLTLKLRDGFSHDQVTVRLDGQQVYQHADLSTDLTISFADQCVLEVAAPQVTLQVSLARGLSKQRLVTPAQTPFVEVWVVDGDIDLRASRSETPML